MLATGKGPSYNVRKHDGRSMGAVGHVEDRMGVKKTGKGRRKLGQKKRRMRAPKPHHKG